MYMTQSEFLQRCLIEMAPVVLSEVIVDVEAAGAVGGSTVIKRAIDLNTGLAVKVAEALCQQLWP